MTAARIQIVIDCADCHGLARFWSAATGYVDEEIDGFVRIHHRQGRILGATVVAPAAGELIGTLAYAM